MATAERQTGGAWAIVDALGRGFLRLIAYARGVDELVRYSLTHLRRLRLGPVRTVFLKQVYFTGIEALGAVSVIAMLAGIVITTQVTSLVGQNARLMAEIMLWTVVRELGPLLTAIVIVARSSSATASELATMNIRGEMDALRLLGIPPRDYLVVPRVTGITLSVAAVTIYFQAVAILVGLAFAASMLPISFGSYIGAMMEVVTLHEVWVSFLKGLVFGFVISGTSCYYGLGARGSVTAVPRAATRAVMRNLITVFLLDGAITWVAFF
jgi:phospholipid/cholesterol/gamma-HCH transport system permease protein